MQKRKASRSREMFAALDRRDIGRLTELVACGGSPDATCDFAHEKSVPLLCYAAGCQFMEAVALLLKLGADPNAQAVEVTSLRPNSTALRKAIFGSDTKAQKQDERKRLEIVKLLLRSKADPNLPDCRAATPLYHAAASGYEEIVSELASAGADPGSAGFKLLSPLIGASLNQKTPQAPIIKLLLERGSLPNCRNESGKTSLMLSSLVGAEEAVQMLLKAGADVNNRSQHNETALIHAARYAGDSAMLGEHETAVRIYNLLLDAGADAQVRAEPSPALPIGGTAIEIGLRSENPLLIDFLRKRFPSEAAN
jgi:ankyrin repeat protein